MIAFLRACVGLGFVVGFICVLFHIYIAHLEQIHMTKKPDDNQILDKSRISQWPAYVRFWPRADIIL